MQNGIRIDRRNINGYSRHGASSMYSSRSLRAYSSLGWCVKVPSSSARLATPEVVDRPCCNSVESAYWSGDFLKRFFLFDPSLTSGMSVVLMWATVYDSGPTLNNTCLLYWPSSCPEMLQTQTTTSHQTRA